MDISAIVALVTLPIIALTLIANSLQAREVARQSALLASTNRLELALGITQESQRLSEQFLARPHLRKYFYGTATIDESNPDFDAVNTLAEMYFDFMSLTLSSLEHLTDDERAGWREYFSDLVRQSQAMQIFWTSRQDWYENALNLLVEEALHAEDSGPSVD